LKKEFHLEKEISFLFYALAIDVKNENAINNLFTKDSIIITVINHK